MDLFDYLRGAKLNKLEEAFGGSPEDGPNPFQGLLGMEKKLDDATAAKFSDTNVGLCKNGLYKLIRTDPTIADPTKWVVGRPVFWVDTNLWKCTTVAAATSRFAGVAISNLEEAGNVVLIQTYGDALGLWAAASTKAVPALGDPLQLKIAANLADLEVILDATGWTNVQQKAYVGKVLEVPANPAASGVKRIWLDGAQRVFNRGVR